MDDTQKKILAVAILGIGAYVFYAAQANAAEPPAPLLPAPDPTPPPTPPPTPEPQPRSTPRVSGGGGSGSSASPEDIGKFQLRVNALYDELLTKSKNLPASSGVSASELSAAGLQKIDLSKGGVGKFGPQTTKVRDGWFNLYKTLQSRTGNASIKGMSPDDFSGPQGHPKFFELVLTLPPAGSMSDTAFKNFCSVIKGLAGTEEEASVEGYANAKDSGRVGQALASPEIELFQQRLNGYYDAISSVPGVSTADLHAGGLYKIDLSKGGVGVLGPATRRLRDGMLRVMVEAIKKSQVADSMFTSQMADLNGSNFMAKLNKLPSAGNLKSSDKQKLAAAVKSRKVDKMELKENFVYAPSVTGVGVGTSFVASPQRYV